VNVFCERSDCSRFLVRDDANEKKFSFVLADSLNQAAGHQLLEGYKVHVTKNVKPEPNQMRGNCLGDCAC